MSALLQAISHCIYHAKTIMCRYIYEVLTETDLPIRQALLTANNGCVKLTFWKLSFLWLSLLHKRQNLDSCKLGSQHELSLFNCFKSVSVCGAFSYSCLHFLSFLCVCLSFTLCVCQRWVTEKLSVESLRDLELFGGEVHCKHRY